MKRILKINTSKFITILGIVACTFLSSCSQQEGKYGEANQECGLEGGDIMQLVTITKKSENGENIDKELFLYFFQGYFKQYPWLQSPIVALSQKKEISSITILDIGTELGDTAFILNLIQDKILTIQQDIMYLQSIIKDTDERTILDECNEFILECLDNGNKTFGLEFDDSKFFHKLLSVLLGVQLLKLKQEAEKRVERKVKD